MERDISNLVKWYAEIADLTLEHCQGSCRRMGSCCEEAYCEITIQYALDWFGVTLVPIENHKIPLLGDDHKCIAAPHLRPMCSYHSCDINGIGVFRDSKGSTDFERTEKYFALREQIEAEFYRVFKDKIDGGLL